MIYSCVAVHLMKSKSLSKVNVIRLHAANQSGSARKHRPIEARCLFTMSCLHALIIQNSTVRTETHHAAILAMWVTSAWSTDGLHLPLSFRSWLRYKWCNTAVQLLQSRRSSTLPETIRTKHVNRLPGFSSMIHYHLHSEHITANGIGFLNQQNNQ